MKNALRNVDDIKMAITELSPQERAALRVRFDELEAQLWDEQIEQDIHAGKLDALAAAALEVVEAGRATEL